MSGTPTTVSGSAVLEPSSVNNSAVPVVATGTISAATSGTISLTTGVVNTILLVGVSIVTSGVTVSSITDTRSLKWQKVAGCTIAAGTIRGEMWWASEPLAQTHTITVNLSASGTAAMVAGSFSGVNYATPFDPLTPFSATGSSVTPSVAVGTVNPADMLLGFVACAGAPTFTVGSTPIAFTTVTSVTNTTVSAAMEYAKLTAASQSNTTYYTLGTTEVWVIIGVALMSSGSNTLLVQAPTSQEFILKNIFYGGQCSFSKWDGNTNIQLYNPSGAGGQVLDAYQVTPASGQAGPNPSWFLFVNTSATTPIDVGYEGIRSI